LNLKPSKPLCNGTSFAQGQVSAETKEIKTGDRCQSHIECWIGQPHDDAAAGRVVAIWAEATELRQWEIAHFNQLVERLANPDHLAVLSWENLIKCVRDKDPEAGAELGDFYDRCRTFA
jgi:hypothetical protein